jgi:Leucine-rich repeat (LRR) protein
MPNFIKKKVTRLKFLIAICGFCILNACILNKPFYKNEGKRVSLTYKRLTVVPEEVLGDTSITELLLSFNKIDEIDPRIVQLNNLESFSLQANNFTSFPKEICLLKNLKYLNLSNNKIDSIPNCIQNLSQLETFRCSNCHLSYISDSISELKNLDYLDLSSNILQQIPNSLFLDSSLTFLDLSANQLVILSDSISNLKNLEQLNLERAGGALFVPESLCELNKLVWLKVDYYTILPNCIFRTRMRRLVIEGQ